MFVNILFLLLVGHALCDYPLQGDLLAKGKNHKNPLIGIPWYQCLIAHALIQSGSVYLITSNLTLAFLELVTHTIIDYLKCNEFFNFNFDQFLHILCKILWVLCLYWKIF